MRDCVIKRVRPILYGAPCKVEKQQIFRFWVIFVLHAILFENTIETPNPYLLHERAAALVHMPTAEFEHLFWAKLLTLNEQQPSRIDRSSCFFNITWAPFPIYDQKNVVPLPNLSTIYGHSFFEKFLTIMWVRFETLFSLYDIRPLNTVLLTKFT